LFLLKTRFEDHNSSFSGRGVKRKRLIPNAATSGPAQSITGSAKRRLSDLRRAT